MEALTLSDIKGFNRQQILRWYNELGLPYPGDADLDYLRGNLRLLKLKSEKSNKSTISRSSSQDSSFELYEQVDGYENELVIQHEQLLSTNVPVAATVTNVSPTLTPAPGSSSIAPDTNLDLQNSVPCDLTMNREKSPFYQPSTYTGKGDQDVQVFFNRFERAAKINGWEDAKKVLYLPMYLENAALSFFENVEVKNPTATYADYKKGFLKTFAPVENKELLMLELNSRVQQPNETVAEYTADVEKLCWLVDSGMEESKICGHILKGLNPAMMQQISILDNSTIDLLKSNISKYEQGNYLLRRRFGVTGQPNRSNTADIEAKINSLTEMVHEIKMSSGFNRERSHSRSRRFDMSPSRHERNSTLDTSKHYPDRRSRRDWSPLHSNRSPSYEDYRPSTQNYNYRSPARSHYSVKDNRGRSPYGAQTPYKARSPYRSQSPYDSRSRDSHREERRYGTRYDTNRQVHFSKSPSQPCRNCHKMGHFTADCRAPRYQKN